MKLTALGASVIVLSVAGAACNGASDVATGDANAAAVATGTSGAESAPPAAQQAVDAELPATASPLPLIAGLGMLALAAAAGLRLIR